MTPHRELVSIGDRPRAVKYFRLNGAVEVLQFVDRSGILSIHAFNDDGDCIGIWSHDLRVAVLYKLARVYPRAHVEAMTRIYPPLP